MREPKKARPRLVICSMLPVMMRYSEWWGLMFCKEISNLVGATHDVVCLPFSPDYLRAMILGKRSTSSIANAFAGTDTFLRANLDWETTTLKGLQGLKKDDILLVLDCAMPGLVGAYLRTHKPCKAFGICHGTSMNYLDIFPESRREFDASILSVYDTVFVASKYHENKIQEHSFGVNLVNIGALPDNPHITITDIVKPIPVMRKDGSICIVDRDCGQKRNHRVLNSLELFDKLFYIDDIHGHYTTWEAYYRALSNYRYMLVTTKEETYGYQIQDALAMDCIPLCPNQFCFPEILPEEFLYEPSDDVITMTRNIVDKVEEMGHLLDHPMFERGNLIRHRLNNAKVQNFFPNLVQQIM